MNDLEIARNKLHKEHAAMIMVKDGDIIFVTHSHRISGFLEAINTLGGKLECASVADRVAGKAVALLCAFIKAKDVYAETLSKKAKTFFDDNGIPCEWEELVENILDPVKVGPCPFEEISKNISNPSEAYVTFRNLQKSLICRD